MHFAVQLPLLVIHDVLGLPSAAAEQVRAWTDDFADLVWGNPTAEAQIAQAYSSVALWRFCADTVSGRADRGHYGPGLIGELLRYRNNDDSNLTIAEVAALALNIVGAGWITTAGALGNALAHALADPGRWALLAYDEHYLNLHVEETPAAQPRHRRLAAPDPHRRHPRRGHHPGRQPLPGPDRRREPRPCRLHRTGSLRSPPRPRRAAPRLRRRPALLHRRGPGPPRTDHRAPSTGPPAAEPRLSGRVPAAVQDQRGPAAAHQLAR